MPYPTDEIAWAPADSVLPAPPPPGDRRGHLPPQDRTAPLIGSVVGRTVNRLKQHRAITTRYEKLEETFHALLTIACILRWLWLCRQPLAAGLIMLAYPLTASVYRRLIGEIAACRAGMARAGPGSAAIDDGSAASDDGAE